VIIVPEQITRLCPKGTDFGTIGRSTGEKISAADIAACLCDLNDVQELILLSIHGIPTSKKGMEALHLRVCRLMLREKWTISKKDSKRKALLLLTTIGFYSYISPKPPTIREMYEFMGVSRYIWHQKWSKKYSVMMEDFNDYLSDQERTGNRMFYRRYIEGEI